VTARALLRPVQDCTATKRAHQYLCRGCWATLHPRTRTALSRHDDLAVRRLSQLLEQLRAGVALHKIEVTP